MRSHLSLLIFLCLGVLGCSESGEQYHAREVGGNLRFLYAKWEQEGRSPSFNITNHFYIGHTTNQVYFFTNRVSAGGVLYNGRFALRSPARFTEPGIMVLSDQGVLLWLADDRKIFVSPDKRWFSSSGSKTPAPSAELTPDRVQRCVALDTLWADRLVHMAVESSQTGTSSRMLQQLHRMEAAFDETELTEEGIGFSEPLLVSHDESLQKLISLAHKCRSDINVVRFLPLDEKKGFTQAVAAILQNSASMKSSRP